MSSGSETGQETATVARDDEFVLRAEGLVKQFGAFTAVDGVDFELRRGELRGLIGPNGAGKTTLFNMVSGMLDPTAGTIWFEGEDITDTPPHLITRKGMSLAFQITSVFPDMTVMENVLGALNGQKRVLNPLASYHRDQEGRDRALEILGRVSLAEHAEATVANLSHGDQKVLEIALALAGDPDLLLLDEPTAGLSASETRQVVDLIEELRGDITIMLIEHDMEVVMQVADGLTVLHNGRVIAEGTPDEIRKNEQVQEVYFGREY